jgi:hypothetical protein
VGLGAMAWYRLVESEELELTPSSHWPEPTVAVEPHPDDGPVLVMVEYQIEAQHARDFTFAMQAVRRQRLREGASRSGLYRDPTDLGRYIETLVVESWAEHLRLYERVTVSDRIAEERARAFHIGRVPPAVSHFVYAHRSDMPN